MPVWASVLIGLGSGLLGVLVNVTYHRGAEMRARRLTAADEFLSLTGSMLFDIRDVQMPVIGGTSHGGPRTRGRTVDDVLAEVQRSADEVEQRLARILLLFGHDSRTGRTAQTLGTHLRNAASQLAFVRHMPSQSAPEATELAEVRRSSVSAFGTAHAAAASLVEQFGREARTACDLLPMRWWHAARRVV